MSMPYIEHPERIDITIYQGATLELRKYLCVKQSDGTLVPVDLSGCQGRSEIRENYKATEILGSFRTDNGTMTLNAAPGEIFLMMPPEDTALLPILRKPGVWDVEIIWPDDKVTRVLSGAVTIDPEVTRRD